MVPGRFSETKQTMLAAEILQPWCKQTVFCTGVMPTKTYLVGLHALGYQVSFVKGSDYHRLIRKARVAFTATMADAICVSMAECASAGAILVAPNRGPFPEYANPDFLYTPFSISDAREKMDHAMTRATSADMGESRSGVSRYYPFSVASRIRDVVDEFSGVVF